MSSDSSFNRWCALQCIQPTHSTCVDVQWLRVHVSVLPNSPPLNVCCPLDSRNVSPKQEPNLHMAL